MLWEPSIVCNCESQALLESPNQVSGVWVLASDRAGPGEDVVTSCGYLSASMRASFMHDPNIIFGM